VPERRHDGHIRGAGAAAVSSHHLRIEPGCRSHCRFCQASRIKRHGQRTGGRASSFSRHRPALDEPGARYIVVSTQGRGDEAALLAALAVDADYVAFVGSRKKAQSLKALLAERGIPHERLAKLKAPAGLDLGAITPEEIAISILAEIVAVQRRKDSRGSPPVRP
jgi:xanthine/CO dehydrogenase XdhC/CoxF family maturation factor